MMQVAVGGDGRREVVVGLQRQRDAVGDGQPGLLAQVVERPDQLAGQALGRRSSSSSRSRATAHAAVLGQGERLVALGPHLDVVGR